MKKNKGIEQAISERLAELAGVQDQMETLRTLLIRAMREEEALCRTHELIPHSWYRDAVKILRKE